ncbi:MAG TPA: hypothetical protein VFM69_03985 [Pricia sp.]|nr:hypothetical protein [Pricia sp.]
MLQPSTILLLFLAIGLPSPVSAQEIKTFRVSDFDLRGNVKSCLVLTDYGKEEYHFDESGRLTRSITRYSDSDYEVTHYKYRNGELMEKRVENYRDNTFDKDTSLAYFYQIDTAGNRKVTEKIVSYNKQLLEQNMYRYHPDGKLTKIVRTDTDGTDHTTIRYDTLDGKVTVTRKLNREPLKSVQTWRRDSQDGSPQQLKLTEIFFDGLPNIKIEEVRNANGDLISRAEFLYDAPTEKWMPQEEVTYDYDESGTLVRSKTKRRNAVSTTEFIYQFDGTEAHNWVKKIKTPENSYTTRKIRYYKSADKADG